MERKILRRLDAWRTDPQRKPLIIQGARQVGKTFSILEFGRNRYSNVIYVNFESNVQAVNIFRRDLEPERIIDELSVMFRQNISPGNTLIFFDEIQACERALTSLKYFCEGKPEYHIISAGSLLGVALNRNQYSFPVGKVMMETLYPLDFEEFLWAMGRRDLADLIRRCYEHRVQMSLHEIALDYFRLFMVVGGMPEVVLSYKKDADYNLATAIQKNILTSYLADMAKYALPSETTRIMAAFQSIPSQLAKPNHKFMYRHIKPGARAHEYESAVHWLRCSGIIHICHRIAEGKLPLSVYAEPSFFKIYMADTGLLSSHFGIPAQIIREERADIDMVKGALTENYVCFSLVVNGYTPYYWESKGRAEVDFVLQSSRGEIIPIEVKSSDNVRSKSLARFCELYPPSYAIRLSTKNFGSDSFIRSIPLYALFCLDL